MHHWKLFEVLPDMFPPYMTETEIELWSMFYDELKRETPSGS